MTVRRWAAVTAVALVLGGVAACGTNPPGSGNGPSPTGSNVLGQSPSPGPVTTPAPKPTTVKPVAKALTCNQVRNGKLGSPTVKYQGYADYLPLADGVWSGEDGNMVEVKLCAIGDLNSDGAADALVAVELTPQGTGRFWSLAYWRNSGGSPVFAAVLDLDDRTPVESITIGANKATVVWLTRGPSDPAIGLTIRRTSVFKVSGATLTELSHTDAAYTP
jgi:hypothetical protein